jgi:hypothetical protein
MIERGNRLSLAVEAVTELPITREVWGKDFDRDGALKPRVAALVDLAHPARADRGEDFVRTEASAGVERHGEWLGL